MKRTIAQEDETQKSKYVPELRSGLGFVVADFGEEATLVGAAGGGVKRYV